ncbi:hypothetical protein [Clostridium sp.]|uniref:hypothetical protein n=1 Tax=Clostridium sp. TaxID=1506 RepID=UPI0028461709|nr:hypothetical protein [Clostridium sp.]MDR3598074.1 hypothetical protein [Clostridium sp.]
MKFSYELSGIGWAEANIEINGCNGYFSVSYLNDALKELLEAIMILLMECVPKDEVKKQSKFEWHAEPGGDVWNLTSIDNNQLHILIESYTDLYKKSDKKIILDEVCDTRDFIKCIIDEMDNIIKNYGFVGYRETWYNHDFPISAYLKLKNYLITKKRFNVEHIERYPGNEYSRSELHDELKLFNI